MFEITIERIFSAAHALRLPDGSFEPLHGHDWRVAVTVAAAQLDAMDTVMDFHELEATLETIIGPWRNANLNQSRPFAGPDGQLTINPSAERVAEQIGLGIAGTLDASIALIEAAVGEAPGCTARYRPAGRPIDRD